MIYTIMGGKKTHVLGTVARFLFIIILVFMTYVAWHNSRPAVCPDKYVQYVNAVKTCEVPLADFNNIVQGN